MLSPTREKLERRRALKLVLLGIAELICGLLWRDLADLDFAEGKKASGIISTAATVAFLALGVMHIRETKK